MLNRSFKSAKCKTSLKLAVSRIRLLRNKRAAQVNQMKKELAQLLESGQDRTARIRVEHVVREEKSMAAYDLIEIYCELVAARLPIIESQKNCPIDLKEAITSVIFASPRCSDLPELLDIRKHFTAKYGKEFISSAVELRPDCGVNRMLVEKLSAVAPDIQTKMKILSAIAKENNIKWDHTSFEEINSKPPDDLLNGPNTLDKASKMHAEPPYVQAPPSHYQMHGVPENINAHNARSSTSLQDVVSADINSNKSMSAASVHPRARSGMEPEERESNHLSSVDKNAFFVDRQNWNMDFKDATAAAQAAAESAERASMAARAAAELSSRGGIVRQYSRESKKSSPSGSSDVEPGQFTGSNFTNDSLFKDSMNNSSHDRNPRVRNKNTCRNGQHNMDGVAHRSYRDDVSAMRSGRTASFKSNTASMDEDVPVQSLQKGDRYTQRISVDAESIKPEKGNFFDKGKKMTQFSESDVEYASKSQDDMKDGDNDYIAEATNREQPTSSTYCNDNDLNSNLSYYAYGDDIGNDHFVAPDQGDFQTNTKQSNAYDNAAVLFDDTASDEDEKKFDVEDEYSGRGSLLSPDRKSPHQFSANTNIWSPKNNEIDSVGCFTSQSHLPTESRSASVVNSQLEDLQPMTFDDSDAPSSDSEKEQDTSKPIKSLDKNVLPTKQSIYANDSELTRRRSQGFLVSSLKEVGHAESDADLSSDDITASHSPIRRTKPQSDLNDVQHERKDKEAVHPTESPDVVQNVASVGGGTELSFGTLTGGLKNKGYRRPPYIKNSTRGTSLSHSRQSFMDTSTPTEQLNAFPSGRTSTNSEGSYQEPNNQKVSPEINRKTNSSAPVTDSDSTSDDSEEELPQQPLVRKQESYTQKMGMKGNEKSSSRAPVTYFDSDSGESEEDLRKQASAKKLLSSSGFSRRTKASPSHSGTSYSKVTAVPSNYGSVRKPTERNPSARSSIDTESPPKHQSKHTSSGHLGSSKPLPESKVSLHVEASYPPEKEQPSGSGLTKVASGSSEIPKTSPGETQNSKTTSHVHPKLPDYDALSAHLDSLRLNRK